MRIAFPLSGQGYNLNTEKVFGLIWMIVGLKSWRLVRMKTVTRGSKMLSEASLRIGIAARQLVLHCGSVYDNKTYYK